MFFTGVTARALKVTDKTTKRESARGQRRFMLNSFAV
jgi:hypothetical protein